MGLLQDFINWLASFFIPKAKTSTPPAVPVVREPTSVTPAKPSIDVSQVQTNLQVGGAWGTSAVVMTPEAEAAKTGQITSSSAQVLTQNMVNIGTAEQMATYFGFDLAKVDSIGTDGKNIYVLFKDGSRKTYINPNSAPVNVTYQDPAGNIRTEPPASATVPQTNVAQPVNAANPPPVAAHATAANRINLAGTSLNLDSYYYMNGITNQYGTFYTGYGPGTLPMSSLPRGTTIGGVLANCPANAGLTQTAAPPAPPAPPVVTPPPPPPAPPQKPLVDLDNPAVLAEWRAKAQAAGFAGYANNNALADFVLSRGNRVKLYGGIYG